MRFRKATMATSALASVVLSQLAAGGITTVSVDGIPGAFMQWDVPVLHPGDFWTRSFLLVDPGNATTRVWGTIEAVCWNTGGSLNLTEFGMESQGAARTLDFDFLAHIEYGFSAGLKGAYQKFDADEDLNSANARIIWTKGAVWNNIVLPQLTGFYDPDDLLHSSLFDRISRWGYLSPVVHLTSETTVEMLTGANFDGVYFPDSAYDYVPTPSTGVCLIGAALCGSSRRKR